MKCPTAAALVMARMMKRIAAKIRRPRLSAEGEIPGERRALGSEGSAIRAQRPTRDQVRSAGAVHSTGLGPEILEGSDAIAESLRRRFEVERPPDRGDQGSPRTQKGEGREGLTGQSVPPASPGSNRTAPARLKSHRPRQRILRQVRSDQRAVKRQPPSAGRPAHAPGLVHRARASGLSGPPLLIGGGEALPPSGGLRTAPGPLRNRASGLRKGNSGSPAQAPERRPCSIVWLPTVKPRSVLDPSGSPTISRSMIGPSLISCSLIRCNNSSSDALSVGFLLSSPARRTADSFGCRKAATFSARAAAWTMAASTALQSACGRLLHHGLDVEVAHGLFDDGEAVVFGPLLRARALFRERL
jgi:hypothetical protein